MTMITLSWVIDDTIRKEDHDIILVYRSIVIAYYHRGFGTVPLK